MEETNERELLKKELEQFPFLQKFEKEDVISALYAFFSSLVPEEARILSILYNYGAMSILALRRKYVEEILTHLRTDDIKMTLQLLNFPDFDSLMRAVKTLPERKLSELIGKLNKTILPETPSYPTFKKILQNFESMGIVQKRILKGRKAETVWYLAPSFSKLLSQVVQKLEEKGNKNITSIERLLYYKIKGKSNLSI